MKNPSGEAPPPEAEGGERAPNLDRFPQRHTGSLGPTSQYELPRHGMAAGGVTTTMTHLLAFARMHLADGTAADGTSLLRAESARAMRTPRATCPAKELADQWGIGWMLNECSGRPVIGHGGSTLGQNTAFFLVPDAGVAIALAINGPRGHSEPALLSGLFADLAGVVFPRPLEPPERPPAVDVSRFVGTYRRYDTRLRVEPSDDGLQLRMAFEGAAAKFLGFTDLPPVPLIADEPDGTFLTLQPQWSDMWTTARFFGGVGQHPQFLHLGGRAARRVRSQPQ